VALARRTYPTCLQNLHTHKAEVTRVITAAVSGSPSARGTIYLNGRENPTEIVRSGNSLMDNVLQHFSVQVREPDGRTHMAGERRSRKRLHSDIYCEAGGMRRVPATTGDAPAVAEPRQLRPVRPGGGGSQRRERDV
jgi:hypothetical protein